MIPIITKFLELIIYMLIIQMFLSFTICWRVNHDVQSIYKVLLNLKYLIMSESICFGFHQVLQFWYLLFLIRLTLKQIHKMLDVSVILFCTFVATSCNYMKNIKISGLKTQLGCQSSLKRTKKFQPWLGTNIQLVN